MVVLETTGELYDEAYAFLCYKIKTEPVFEFELKNHHRLFFSREYDNKLDCQAYVDSLKNIGASRTSLIIQQSNVFHLSDDSMVDSLYDGLIATMGKQTLHLSRTLSGNNGSRL